jgi:predicted O-linked N-acetylglucosamine transferase (SPINDLY family)
MTIDNEPPARTLDELYFPGLELSLQGRAAEAVSFYRDALEAASDPSTVAYLLGYQAQALNALGYLDEALERTRLALQLDPSQISAQCPRAYALLVQGRFEECLECCDQALAYHPERAELLHNRTAALGGLRRVEDALDTSNRILRINPNDVRALRNSAVMLDKLRRYSESVDYYRHAASLDPSEPWLLGLLVNAQSRLFDWSELGSTVDKISRAVAEGKPAVEPFHYLPVCDDPQRQLDAARIYAARSSVAAQESTAFCPPGEPRERIRVGYFSSDFRSHPVMDLLAEVFELHDRSQFEIHAFSSLEDPDDPAQIRARAAFDHFHNVDGMLNQDVVALARRVGLDIAVDLNGHTQGAQSGAFATRVAPVQITYLGFPGGTGTPYIDYIVADPVVIAPALRHFYSEKVISLPGSFQPNDRKRQQPDTPLARADYGLPEHGFVFCCFNSPVKLQPALFDRWIRILQAVEGSVLWIFSSNEERARSNLLREAMIRGLDPARIIFAEHLPLQQHLARHRCADLFLDTLPFNAGATASCALWCGLPVLTVSGRTFASRYGASLLTAVGLPELVAPDLDAYEAMAIEFARAPHRFDAIKRKLEIARDQSALFDTPRYVRGLEAAYKTAWRRYCSGMPPDHIEIAAE